jgi:hypothetical protein
MILGMKTMRINKHEPHVIADCLLWYIDTDEVNFSNDNLYYLLGRIRANKALGMSSRYDSDELIEICGWCGEDKDQQSKNFSDAATRSEEENIEWLIEYFLNMNYSSRP